MDILAHGLWTAAAAKAANGKLKIGNRLNILKTAFWGIFPDFFAFTPLFLYFAYQIASGQISLNQIPHHPVANEPPLTTVNNFLFSLTGTLYSLSHSLLTFLLVFLLAWLIFKKPVLELSGWFLHILIDIPTHSYQFYPTPFLWPASGFRFNGLSWANPWFIIVNYSALLLVYIYLWLNHRRNKSVHAEN